LVEPYQIAPSVDLEENSNFRVFDDSLVDVDAEELNVVLSSSGQVNINEDNDHIEDCDEGETIQLMKKKKKILTNYQNEALCKTFFSCNNHLKYQNYRHIYRRNKVCCYFIES
jgi:hypothetical protein